MDWAARRNHWSWAVSKSVVRLLRDQRLERGLVQNRRPELLRPSQFRPGVLPGDEVARLFGHRVAQHAAEIFDPLFDLGAAVALESTGDHDREPGQWPTAPRRLLGHVD